jgi:ABC-type polysaccharide/polyol phosphate export permease
LIASWSSQIGVGDAAVTGAGLLGSILSPVFYPASSLHPALAAAAWLSPYSHVASLLGDAATDTAIDPARFGVLTAMMLISVAASFRFLRWDL